MEDGKLSEGEKLAVPGIREQLLEFRRRADETLAVLEKAVKQGIFT